MGTITISVRDETEQRFRKAVRKTIGTGKGTLGKAVTEAMEKWVEELEQAEVRKRALATLEKGFQLGFKGYRKRSELYDNRIHKIR